MNITLIVVSESRSLRRFLGDTKSTVIPPNSLKKGYLAKFVVNTQVNAVDPADLLMPQDLEKLVLRRSDRANFVIVLIDESKVGLASNIRNSAFIDVITPQEAERSPQNYLWLRLARIVKAINYLAPMFGRVPDYEILALPLRNFIAPELNEICRIISQIRDEPDFVGRVDSQMKLLRRRVRPRSRSSMHTQYAVDDKSRFFVFGKELHSRPETGRGHFPYCVVASRFRFGARIDDRRHYNVSQGERDTTHVDGEYCNCHGISNREKKNPGHLNMFSNDYY